MTLTNYSPALSPDDVGDRKELVTPDETDKIAFAVIP